MASRYKSFAKPAAAFLKSTSIKPTFKPTSSPSLPTSLTTSRSISQLGSLQSLLPLYSAVSSARLTSCLGIDSTTSKSLSQELGLSGPR